MAADDDSLIQFVHIGLPKSASTWLQDGFFNISMQGRRSSPQRQFVPQPYRSVCGGCRFERWPLERYNYDVESMLRPAV